jgi:hypothetical protein
MSTEPYLDPLAAADSLLQLITGENIGRPTELDLARHIDAFLYSLRFLLVDEVESDPVPGSEPPEWNKRIHHLDLKSRFPMIGLYWKALDSRIMVKENGETGAGDGLDDLGDIEDELLVVRWFEKNHGRDAALSALRWRYEHHLHMHILPIRAHLEELIFLGQPNDQDQPR